jgi:poly(3-hydroxybutyrate) depolymerase
MNRVNGYGERLVAVMLVLGATLAVAMPVAASMIEKTGTFGGLTVTYKVVLPDGFDAAKEYPVVVVFTGGPQLLRMAESTLNADWRTEAERRGYIVVSPATPNGDMFYAGADRIFPDFFDQLLRDYKVKGRTFHIAGHSNGGFSAFHIAGKYPRYVATVTGYPGLFNGAADYARAPALKGVCLFMHAGERDPWWVKGMEEQSRELKGKGYRVSITVEPKQSHRIRAAEVNLSPRLFDEIESCQPAR